jgi:putative Mg2+ transporter-C (MgtC) family protein
MSGFAVKFSRTRRVQPNSALVECVFCFARHGPNHLGLQAPLAAIKCLPEMTPAPGWLHCSHADLRDGRAGRQAVHRAGQCVFAFRGDRVEREIRHKSAGLRTYTVVGTSAALFLLISKYGFTNVLADGLVVLDPSRVAAQIVTGIGFIGAGLIFVREDRVQGLTTAATVWLVTAIGMACAAGLLLLALAATMAYFIVAFAFPPYCVYFPARRCPSNRSGDRNTTSLFVVSTLAALAHLR